MIRSALLFATLFLPSLASAQSTDDPLAVARAVAAAYPTETGSLNYIPALTWRGELQLTRATGEAEWWEGALAALRPWLVGESSLLDGPSRLTGLAGAAAIFDAGSVLGSSLAVEIGREVAAAMRPDAPVDLVRSATGWTDDIFMASSVLARAARRTGDPAYERMVTDLIAAYTARLRRSDGLFGHEATARVAWGRGNGFAAFGMMEALSQLPADAPGRTRILEIYRLHMATLRDFQSEDGSWHQVIDVPASASELSVTAMTVTAMARGIRLGWLDTVEYLPTVLRGWRAVASRVDADGRVRDACASTPAGTSLDFYLDRPIIAGFDDRAGGLVLLAALEVQALATGSTAVW